MSEVKKCPKCGSEMEEGEDLTPVSIHWVRDVKFRKKGDEIGDKIVPFYCRNCGYMELYKEMKPGEQPPALGFLKRCVKCNRQIPIASEECQYCGAKQKQKEE